MSDGWAQVFSAFIGSVTTIVLAVLTNKWANDRNQRKRDK